MKGAAALTVPTPGGWEVTREVWGYNNDYNWLRFGGVREVWEEVTLKLEDRFWGNISKVE